MSSVARAEEAIERLERTTQIFGFLAYALLIASWIMCIVHGFGRKPVEGILLILFGNPCCCCINWITVLIYSFAVYSGDNRWWPRALAGIGFLIVVVLAIMRFSVIWHIVSDPTLRGSFAGG